MYNFLKHIICKKLYGLTEPQHALREKCPNTEFFLVRISRIRTEYGEIWSISSYSVRMRENRTRKNPVFGHFSRSDSYSIVKNLAELSLVILINYSYRKYLKWRALLTPKRRNPFLQSSPSPTFVGVLDELRHNFYWHWEVVWNYVFMWSFIQS